MSERQTLANEALPRDCERDSDWSDRDMRTAPYVEHRNPVRLTSRETRAYIAYHCFALTPQWNLCIPSLCRFLSRGRMVPS
jgi:hypothetical protein